MPKQILVPLPDRDFDVTEVAGPWRLLTRAGHRVVFATERGGEAPAADPLLLTGVLFGQLGAEEEAKTFYRELEASPEFQRPIAWGDADPAKIDGLISPWRACARGCANISTRRGSSPKWPRSSGLGALPRPSATASSCWRARKTARPARACSARSGRRASRSTWSAPPTCSPAGSSGATTAPTTPTWRTRCAPRLADPEAQFVRGPRVLTKRGTDADDSAALVVEDGELRVGSLAGGRVPLRAHVPARRRGGGALRHRVYGLG